MENNSNTLLKTVLAGVVLFGLIATLYVTARSDPQLASCAAEAGYRKPCDPVELCAAGVNKGNFGRCFRSARKQAAQSNTARETEAALPDQLPTETGSFQ
jgi:hypothetical protein